MSGSQTHGFDIVFELSSNRLREIMERQVLPLEATFPLPGVDGGLVATLRGGRVDRVNVQAGNRLEVTASYSAVTIAGLQVGGVDIDIESRIGDDGANPRRIVFTFPTRPNIRPRNSDSIRTFITSRRIGASYEQVIQSIGDSVLNTLRSAATMPAIPLNRPIGTGMCALSLSDLRVRTIAGSLFIVLMLSGPSLRRSMPSDINAFNSSLLNGLDSVVLISNETLLASAACVVSQPPSPLTGATFTPSATCQTMTSPLTGNIGGWPITIDALSICVVNNEIVMSGSATQTGIGYSISGTFRVPISFSCRSDGAVIPNFDPNRVRPDVRVRLEPWLYVVGFGIALVAAIFLSPLVGILVAIVVIVLAPILDIIANAVVTSALPGIAAGANRAVEEGYRLLPPELMSLLGMLRCQAVRLDDLALGGVLTPTPAPRLTVDARWSVTNRQVEGTGYDNLVGLGYEDWLIAHSVELRAVTTNFVAPLTHEWTVDGHRLGGSGQVTINGVTVDYSTINNTCRISAPLGGSVNAIVTVRVQGNDGYARTFSLLIAREGRERVYERSALLDLLESDRVYLQGTRYMIRPNTLPDPAPDVYIARDLQANLIEAIGVGMGLSPGDLGLEGINK